MRRLPQPHAKVQPTQKAKPAKPQGRVFVALAVIRVGTLFDEFDHEVRYLIARVALLAVDIHLNEAIEHALAQRGAAHTFGTRENDESLRAHVIDVIGTVHEKLTVDAVHEFVGDKPRTGHHFLHVADALQNFLALFETQFRRVAFFFLISSSVVNTTTTSPISAAFSEAERGVVNQTWPTYRP